MCVEVIVYYTSVIFLDTVYLFHIAINAKDS